MPTDQRIGRGRPRLTLADQHVGARIRERRMLLGLSQQQFAELLGVTYQQAHKYETGLNRVTVARIYQIAEALSVEVAYFFQGLEGSAPSARIGPQPQLMGLVRNFLALPSQAHQVALLELTRVMASGAGSQDDEQ